jgi:hypothetical protein
MAADSNWPEDVKPLDVDGVGAIAIGTLLWAIAFLVLLLFRDSLVSNDAEWWLWVAATGAGLGLLGLAYTTRRRAVYRRAQQESAASSAGTQIETGPSHDDQPDAR